MGYNKLSEEAKKSKAVLQRKFKFVIKALTDLDSAFVLCAYNGLKQRCIMLNGIGLGDSEMKKLQFIKRLMNKGYNLQVKAINGIKEFLTKERQTEEANRAEYERQQKDKDRILKRIMNSNTRMMSTGFRQAFQFMEADREREIALILKQRGIMRQIVDKNARMIAAAYNKLMEEYKLRKNKLLSRMKFVIKALTDTDLRKIVAAYNEMKQRC